MRVRAAAEYLAVSENQIAAFRDSGELEFINIGSKSRPRWRVAAESLAAFERKRNIQPRA
jgi:hypothetical protein